MRGAARLAWIPIAAGLLSIAPASPVRADSDCFQVTREIRALGSTAAELKAALAKAAPKAKADIEKQIADTQERLNARTEDLKACGYTLHVHAVRVNDSCPGQRPADINPDQVRRWVEKANEVYAVAGVRFEFDPTPKSGDWAVLNSTEVNDLYAELPGDIGWERGKAIGNELASHYPAKVLLLFHHGPGDDPTGGGFSSTTYSFVALPGFDVTTVCGVQNAFLLAHEVGHYFGLNHTFRTFKTKAEAAGVLRSAGNKPGTFDADGLAETPPEPFIDELQCTGDTTVTLNGVPFSLNRKNVMSYYHNDTKSLTPEQVRIVRTWVERRFADAMDGVGPYVPDERRTYTIVSAANGKILEVVGASKENGVKVMPADWNGGANQNWKIVPLTASEAGAFEIVSASTGKCLTVESHGSEEGGSLIQWDWEGRKNQKWRLTRDATGDLLIEARQTRRVLTAPDSTKAGDVRLEPPAASQNQKWRLVPQD